MNKEKYLKYKTKYLDLKNQLGGVPFHGVDKNSLNPLQSVRSPASTAPPLQSASTAPPLQSASTARSPPLQSVRSPASTAPPLQSASTAPPLQSASTARSPPLQSVSTTTSLPSTGFTIPIPNVDSLGKAPPYLENEEEFNYIKRMEHLRGLFMFTPLEIIKKHGNIFHDNTYFDDQRPDKERRNRRIHEQYKEVRDRQPR